MNILALSGSLRAASINSAFCRAAARLASPPLQVEVFTGLNDLPLFNPDLETSPARAVLDFRRAVAQADAMIIASPEYAHGISGVMKNALDWLVSFEGTVGKPIALINTSPRAQHGYQALREVLLTMSTRIIPEASITLPLLGACTTEEDMLATPEISQTIRNALAALVKALSRPAASGPNFPLQ
ncbi:NADPH-dependent FMN reductase [Paludibacterium purpuratum]|uniref:NAD(P)H-dependent FMN reductase n=1 Tax=Paludibacterium purpuratum TaxID=1144873 RepID=A0A4R7AVX7_9NEIS|nr:NADPH-dependent FMN reductase [Paludibacterium purpuratum]TDR71084.1 NAD(P)H-dependent FMN reductase [Paludibacterium purpuratum]